MTKVFPLENFKCHAKVPFDTENRPSITDICLVCPHSFGDHNIYCSQCPDKQHEFTVECGGYLKRVHLSTEKWRTTKCTKCGHVWMVKGDIPEKSLNVCPRCGKAGPDSERLYHYSDCPWVLLLGPGVSMYEFKRRMMKPFEEVYSK